MPRLQNEPSARPSACWRGSKPWSPADREASGIRRFADRAPRTAGRHRQPLGGTSGLELEWDLLGNFQPLQRISASARRRVPSPTSSANLPSALVVGAAQLEVFHWMIEWTTGRTTPWLTVAEARLLEACQINALAKAGHQFGERLYAWHGNLLARVHVGHGSIPGGWNLAKRRYLGAASTCRQRPGTARITST
jgi:hypothetical protein